LCCDGIALDEMKGMAVEWKEEEWEIEIYMIYI
jgi:hypothetical protein